MVAARQSEGSRGSDDDGDAPPRRPPRERARRLGRLLEQAARPFTLLALVALLIVPTALSERRERIDEQRRTVLDPLRVDLERLPRPWNTQSAVTRGALAAPSHAPAYAEHFVRSIAYEDEVLADLLALTQNEPRFQRSVERIASLRRAWRERPTRFFAGQLDADGYRAELAQQDELRDAVEAEWRRLLDDVIAASREQQVLAARLETTRALATTLLTIAALLAALLIIWLDARSRRLSAVDAARRRANEAAEQRAVVLAQVSHDLKSPLSAVRVTSQLLRARARRNGDDALLRGLARIETAAARMEGMVSDLLDVARAEAGEPPTLAREPVELRPLVERVADEVGSGRGAKRVVLDVPAHLPAVLANAPKVERVVQNLVDNAIKFSPEGGVVRVHAAHDDGQVRLAVSDQGSGLPAHARERVFEPFWQHGRERPGEGSGLGLAIAKSIVEAHGGRIWLERAREGGSTFVFTLPVADVGGTPRASGDEGR